MLSKNIILNIATRDKSYFARHFYVRINAVLKLRVTGKCMCNIKLIGAFARLFYFLENC